MRKYEALDVLKKFQEYRRGPRRIDEFGITPNLIGQALDVAIETMEISIDLTPKKDRSDVLRRA